VKDEKAISKLESKLGIIEGEIIDLKNKGRNNTRSQMITGAMGGVGGIGMSTQGFAEKFDVLVEEVN
jgi:hypothetical protein